MELSISPTVVLAEAEFFQGLLRSHVDQLCADNVLTDGRADDWWRVLAEQAADGHFLGGAVIFVVAATRPT